MVPRSQILPFRTSSYFPNSMHILIFVGLMCICLPNLFLAGHDQCPKKALFAQLSSAYLFFKIKINFKKLAWETIKLYFGLIVKSSQVI